MKTRTYIKLEAANDMERIMQAHMILREHVKKHPAEKATIRVPLENGNFIVLSLTPVC